ncbi:MAG: 30S ribosomal protein S24e [Desulfurococcales archaeon]|nr:30S ribosomal protein S24e [Desulfurococcales archaeon]
MKTASLEDGSVLHVLEERHNKVIGRLEISGVVTHVGKGTPSRGVVRSAIAKIYGKDESLVVIKYIKSEYGMGRSKIKAHIYENEDRLKLFEPDYILKRGE